MTLLPAAVQPPQDEQLLGAEVPEGLYDPQFRVGAVPELPVCQPFQYPGGLALEGIRDEEFVMWFALPDYLYRPVPHGLFEQFLNGRANR